LSVDFSIRQFMSIKPERLKIEASFVCPHVKV